MSRRIFFAALLFPVVSVVPHVYAATFSLELYNYLIRSFSPRDLSVVVRDVKRGKKNVVLGYLRIDTRGANVEGLCVDRLVVEATNVRVNDVKGWKKNRLRVYAAKGVRFYARVRRDDINKFLNIVEKKVHDPHFSGGKVKFKPPYIVIAAVYRYNLIFKFGILVELKSRLKVEGSRVILTDYSMFAGGLKLDKKTTEKIIRNMNPLLDLKDFPIPMMLKSIKLTKDAMELRSANPPVLDTP